MPKYISLLRGINVGGNRKILMADLKILYSRLGFQNIATYIQSGNVVFETTAADTEQIAQSIAQAIQTQYGFDVPTMVIAAADMHKIAAENPFLAADSDTPIERLHVTFLAKAPAEAALQKIATYHYAPDIFSIKNQAAYIACEKYNETKLSNAFFEKQLGVNATTRNWKTVLQLVALSE
jgi:uncharacterized protein (DUF1697 family)